MAVSRWNLIARIRRRMEKIRSKTIQEIWVITSISQCPVSAMGSKEEEDVV